MWKIINKFGDVILQNLTPIETLRFMGKNLGKGYKYKEQQLTIKQKLKTWINKN